MRRSIVASLLVFTAGCSACEDPCRKTCVTAEYCGYLPSDLGSGAEVLERIESCEQRCENTDQESVRDAIADAMVASQVSLAMRQKCSGQYDDDSCIEDHRDEVARTAWCEAAAEEDPNALNCATAKKKLGDLMPVPTANLLARINNAAPATLASDAAATCALASSFTSDDSVNVTEAAALCEALEVDRFIFFIGPYTAEVVIDDCTKSVFKHARLKGITPGAYPFGLEIVQKAEAKDWQCWRLDAGKLVVTAVDSGLVVVNLPTLEELASGNYHAACQLAGPPPGRSDP